MFQKLKNYESYIKKNPFHKELNIELKNYGELNKKIKKNNYESVDPYSTEPFKAELDDLIRLHYLITTRKVSTILEFGVGKSTIVFNHALKINKLNYNEFVTNNLRRSNPFECHSLDNNFKWIREVQKNYQTENVIYHHAKCNVSTFNDRICTFYDKVPNICPDFIYLDGPDQFSPKGNIRGVSTNNPDRLPMAADILSFEHFLLPGTLVAVDGRTANARFLKSNLQRNWSYEHFVEYDQHFFELCEQPLGIYNKRQIDFCLNKSFYKRIKK